MTIIILLHFISLNVFICYEYNMINKFLIRIWHFKNCLNLKENRQHKGKGKSDKKNEKKIDKPKNYNKKNANIKNVNKKNENIKNINKKKKVKNESKKDNPPKRTKLSSYTKNGMQDLTQKSLFSNEKLNINKKKNNKKIKIIN